MPPHFGLRIADCGFKVYPHFGFWIADFGLKKRVGAGGGVNKLAFVIRHSSFFIRHFTPLTPET
ncbi:hypothetical protein D1AOALGA4SA_12415 [Olavius algarvensis Delta 1 endosymbiont]|nr:hypothetical protein D1AOALGA4SA_12415 [Olavius algarvensis Delta 1 endosymbiont]